MNIVTKLKIKKIFGIFNKIIKSELDQNYDNTDLFQELTHQIRLDSTLLNLQNPQGNTLLHLAIKEGNKKIFNMLLTEYKALSHNPNYNILNKNKLAPVELLVLKYIKTFNSDTKSIFFDMFNEMLNCNIIISTKVLSYIAKHNNQDLLEVVLKNIVDTDSLVKDNIIKAIQQNMNNILIKDKILIDMFNILNTEKKNHCLQGCIKSIKDSIFHEKAICNKKLGILLHEINIDHISAEVITQLEEINYEIDINNDNDEDVMSNMNLSEDETGNCDLIGESNNN